MATTTLTLPTADHRPTAGELATCGRLLEQGQLLLLPTETVYGIAARADDPRALARLRNLKGRPEAHPLSVHVGVLPGGEPCHALPSKLALPGITRRLATAYWPGPLTLVLPSSDPALAQLTHQGRVGFRAPSQAFTSALLGALDFPVVMSSANLHGEAPATSAEAALQALGPKSQDLALVVDAGPTASAQAAQASSVLVLDKGRFELTREGLLSLADLQKTAGLAIAFACTGNTCRSPMAEALARRTTELLLKAPPRDFGFHFSSMGLAAYPGDAPSAHAVTAMAQVGLDISSHRSTPATAEIALALDHIYTMTRAHKDGLEAALADLEDPGKLPEVHLLDPDGRNISDPFGGSLADYEHAARDIEAAISARASEWL